MSQKLELSVLKEKFNFDIEKLNKVESSVTFFSLQQVLSSTSEYSWATDYKDDIVFMITVDSFKAFEALEEAWLIWVEWILLKDNIRNESKEPTPIVLWVVEGWESKSASWTTYKEQGLYMFSDNVWYHWYVPAETDMKGKQYWFYLWEVHNDKWIYSTTLLFRVGTMTKAVKRKPRKPKIKWVYIDKAKFDIVEACYETRKPCLLMWPTGSWKTTIIKELANKRNKKLTRINLNWEITKEDLLWAKTLEAWTVVWKDWPLTQALREWDLILLDELNAALPEVLLLIQSLTEAHDNKLWELRLNENNWEVLVPHEACRIYWTWNPSEEYIWTKDFNPATLSRWIIIYVDYLKPSDEKALLLWKFSKGLWTKIELVTELVEFADDLRNFKQKEDIIYSCSTRDIEQALELFTMWIKMQDCLDTCILNKAQNSDDKKFISNQITKLWKNILNNKL